MDTVPQIMNVIIRRDNKEYNVVMEYFVSDHDCNPGFADVYSRFDHPISKQQMQSRTRGTVIAFSNPIKVLQEAILMTEQLCGHTAQ